MAYIGGVGRSMIEFTNFDEQITNVRLCHDKQMTDDIYNYIQKKLEEFSRLVLTN